MASFNEGVRDAAKKLLDERLKTEEEAILGGLLEHDEYKRRVGIRQGLMYAKDDLDTAYNATLRA